MIGHLICLKRNPLFAASNPEFSLFCGASFRAHLSWARGNDEAPRKALSSFLRICHVIPTRRTASFEIKGYNCIWGKRAKAFPKLFDTGIHGETGCVID
ncbi:hypothetical protein CSC94_11515 [Zhengella mangrovi]|uniref:Uncharacterized protein n=1 Tax=Zhengella mangrovi TaxID=1982044 RepID=A0A2G1QMH9_9HYPH|nr:hypothetical protein CSC94_11515 [Zhengella mangrovi]